MLARHAYNISVHRYNNCCVVFHYNKPISKFYQNYHNIIMSSNGYLDMNTYPISWQSIH